jgi:hypothetical protein
VALSVTPLEHRYVFLLAGHGTRDGHEDFAGGECARAAPSA